VSGAPALAALRITRVDIHRDIEAGASAPDDQRAQLDQLTHPDRAKKVQRA
jgi:hypothetical protein